MNKTSLFLLENEKIFTGGRTPYSGLYPTPVASKNSTPCSFWAARTVESSLVIASFDPHYQLPIKGAFIGD